MFILIDLEATCWSNESLEGRIKTNQNENEIIEIGATLVDDNLQIISRLDQFVRPSINPILSEFCTHLTSITQKDVDKAPLFPEAWQIFQKQVELIISGKFEDLIFGSWGYYDCRQIRKDCLQHKVKFPFANHFSIKHEFANRRNIKPCGVSAALKLLGMSFEGTQHRAIDDIINISKIFAKEWHSTGFTFENRYVLR